MEGVEVSCPDTKVNKLQFEQIKNSQDKMLDIQNEHNTRLKILEENKVEMKFEFSVLKQSQTEQKALVLELDSKARDAYEKKFEKILLVQEKNESKNDKLFENQTLILQKIVDNQAITNSGRFELNKGKLAIILAVITIFGTLIPIIITKFIH